MGGINKVVGAGHYNRFSGQQSGGGYGSNQRNKNKKSFAELMADTLTSSYDEYESQSQQYDYGKNDCGTSALEQSNIIQGTISRLQ